MKTNNIDKEKLNKYKIERLIDIKTNIIEDTLKLENDFVIAENTEQKYVIAKDYIANINTMAEIEKEIKGLMNKEKEVNKID